MKKQWSVLCLLLLFCFKFLPLTVAEMNQQWENNFETFKASLAETNRKLYTLLKDSSALEVLFESETEYARDSFFEKLTQHDSKQSDVDKERITKEIKEISDNYFSHSENLTKVILAPLSQDESVEANLKKAEVYLMVNMEDEAIAAFLRAWEPKAQRELILKSPLASDENSLERVESPLKNLQEMVFRIAAIRMRKGQVNEAKDLIRQFIDFRSDWIRLHYKEGRAQNEKEQINDYVVWVGFYRSMGQHSEAAKLLKDRQTDVVKAIENEVGSEGRNKIALRLTNEDLPQKTQIRFLPRLLSPNFEDYLAISPSSVRLKHQLEPIDQGKEYWFTLETGEYICFLQTPSFLSQFPSKVLVKIDLQHGEHIEEISRAPKKGRQVFTFTQFDEKSDDNPNREFSIIVTPKGYVDKNNHPSKEDIRRDTWYQVHAKLNLDLETQVEHYLKLSQDKQEFIRLENWIPPVLHAAVIGFSLIFMYAK